LTIHQGDGRYVSPAGRFNDGNHDQSWRDFVPPIQVSDSEARFPRLFAVRRRFHFLIGREKPQAYYSLPDANAMAFADSA